MAETRTINLRMDAVEQATMRHATDSRKWVEAIGYLSTWNMTFPIVEIGRDNETDMLAVYRNADGSLAYAIGAVWHDTHYGFHS